MKHEKPKNGPVSCRDVIGLLSDYVEGELSSAEAARLERHLADCPPCERFLHTLETSIHWTRQLSETEVPQEVMDRLRSFLRTRTRRPPD